MVNMKRTIIFFLLIFSSIVLLRSTEFYEKKLIVVASAGQVHLDPDRNSPCLLYTSPSPRDLSTSRMPSSA